MNNEQTIIKRYAVKMVSRTNGWMVTVTVKATNQVDAYANAKRCEPAYEVVSAYAVELA